MPGPALVAVCAIFAGWYLVALGIPRLQGLMAARVPGLLLGALDSPATLIGMAMLVGYVSTLPQVRPLAVQEAFELLTVAFALSLLGLVRRRLYVYLTACALLSALVTWTTVEGALWVAVVLLLLTQGYEEELARLVTPHLETRLETLWSLMYAEALALTCLGLWLTRDPIAQSVAECTALVLLFVLVLARMPGISAHLGTPAFAPPGLSAVQRKVARWTVGGREQREEADA
ncbi:hypothetical protein LLH03_14060 [bacterium]|nr:hypothetical protein [bacterium]